MVAIPVPQPRFFGVFRKKNWGEASIEKLGRRKEEAAKFMAQAEVTRAEGVAKANKIIGDSLKGNEAYLKYLWVHNLEEGNHDVIYVATEMGLPILEAGRLQRLPAPKSEGP